MQDGLRRLLGSALPVCRVAGTAQGCPPSSLQPNTGLSRGACHPSASPPPHAAQARYAAQQHDAARHAAQTKAALLEEQLGAAAESARRRMEEQLDTFRGDAATARWAAGWV